MSAKKEMIVEENEPMLPDAGVLGRSGSAVSKKIAEHAEVPKGEPIQAAAAADPAVPPRIGYDVFVVANYSEILWIKGAHDKTTWKYIPQPLIQKKEKYSSEFSEKGGYRGVLGVDLVTPAISSLQTLRSTSDGPVNRLTINTEVFRILSKEQAFELALLLVRSIRECKELVIIGNDEESEAVTHLVNHLKVTDHIFANYVFLTSDRLDRAKIRACPVTLFCLDKATPEQILEMAGKRTTINLNSFGADKIDKLLHKWASSCDTSIDTLTLMCARTPDQKANELDAIFESFTRNGVKSMPFLDRQTGLDKLHWDARFVSDVGVEIRRADGAVGTVRYTPHATRSAFTLHVSYFGKPSLLDLLPSMAVTERKMALAYESSFAVCRAAQKSKVKRDTWNHGTDMHRMKPRDRAILRRNYDTDVECQKRAMQRHFDLPVRDMNKIVLEMAQTEELSADWGYYTPVDIVEL